jgi:regulator of protease activity HflC (stomatin/prohibitin superfamily)
MAIGANWAEIWGPVWGPVWTQTATEPEPVPVESNSGGWAFFLRYEQERDRRRKKRQEELEAQEAEESLPPVEKEIAQILHKQERQDARRQEAERLRKLVAEHSDMRFDSPKLNQAFKKAAERQSLSSLLKLDSELKRQLEEEEMAILMLLLND